MVQCFVDGHNLGNMLGTKHSSALQLINQHSNLEIEIRVVLTQEVLQRQSKQLMLGFLQPFMTCSHLHGGDESQVDGWTMCLNPN